jgi:hypothetical protein|tara:strand:- start:159 stop:551 length:393 start_codon:yes stop_codon:yes gene_type:complete
MAVGVWEPQKSLDISEASLRALAASYRTGQSETLSDFLDDTTIKANATLMQQEAVVFDVAMGLDDGELDDLIRLFTLAEMQLPGWEAGKKSPVIYLVRILKARDAFSADLRRWVKANTDNRYLPNGSALL